MKWTNEQLDAIMKDNQSIIVSAGAGSGKTAVLSERVIRKIKDGVNINELLILTFTNKAAAEMRERIRKALKKQNFTEQLNLINEAYITTFDSFALSIIKKYHYILNLPQNISIADSSLIFLQKKKIIENIFENLYKDENALFIKLITDFCIKDDADIKKYILDIYDSANLLINKKEYFENYFMDVMSDKNIENNIKEFEDIILNYLEEINFYLNNISNLDYEYYEALLNSLTNLLEANNYDDIVKNLDIKLPSIPKNSDDELKNEKEKLSNLLKKIKEICEYENISEIKETINLTFDYIKIIIEILNKIDTELNLYKKENNIYEFNDISMMLIEILKNNENIRLELKNKYNEIMIDEYQDTSDIQEEFIKLISNNNVYMVGDIKQSIYRFRNANPYIFKNKYENYSNNNGGMKIDLNKNFRSRSEVLNNINLVFSKLMDSNIGGADYNNGHAMIYGNKAYDELMANNGYNMDVLNYNYDKNNGFTKEEIEIFIIANDILNKIKNKYQVVDKKTFALRDCTFKDFVILVDRSTNFDLFKKIFEYMHIPLTIYKDERLNNEIEITVLKNIIKLILKIKNNEFDNEFKYLFTSIARSFVFEYSDNEIFKYFKENAFNSNDIFNKCQKLANEIDYLTNSLLIEKIIDEFMIMEKIIKLGDVQNKIIRLDYISNLATNLDKLGFTISHFSNYLTDLVDNQYDIRFSLSKDSPDSAQIMTIHTSKGLEFNVCYFPLLYKEFNLRDLNEKFIFDNQYGIICPYFKEGIGKTIYKHLLKNKYIKEEISEKIRLFYVALTRAKENMILIADLSDEQQNDDLNNKLKFRSFSDMLNIIKNDINPYIKNIEFNNINISHDYNINNKEVDLTKFKDSSQKLTIIEREFINEFEETAKFSKSEKHFVSKEEERNLEIGTYFHYLLEVIDFKTKNISQYNIDDFYKRKIETFLNQPIFDDLDECNVYKEYEFITVENGIKKHGIIDLMIEHDSYIDIIDYKFRNIDDTEYNKQLIGYKNYIENKTNKKVNIYLYSIMEEKLKNVE